MREPGHARPRRVRPDRAADVDAVTTRDDIPSSTSDAKLIEIAAADERAVITNNVKDFRPIAACRLQRAQAHAGLILVPSSRRRTRAANTALADEIEAVMRANPGGLVGSERWLG